MRFPTTVSPNRKPSSKNLTSRAGCKILFMEPAEKILFSIVSGSDLTQNDLDSINLLRKREFNADIPISPKPDNESWTDKFFFAKNPIGSILAFGILRVTRVDFHQKTYFVFEFNALIATAKRKGYGALLLNKIKEYAKLQERTLLGFCTSELIPFYLRAGLETIIAETNRFAFYQDRQSFPGETPGEAVFVSGPDGLIEEMKKYPQDTAYITRHKKN